ncbi:MAG: lytic transglycosylase domain-containing protein [Acidimicrobiia bacterium]|nr:lytic transglycosylase domain-containing protein [Acidimicrobiia bacterium]MYJ31727.1 lytic transglycosylase domain-containing protein [Acidimicrobiia bacterium]
MRAKTASRLLGKALPPNAQLALRGARALRGVARFARRRWPWVAVAALFAVLMVGAALDTGTTAIPATAADQARRRGVPAQLWAAYQHTSRLWCHPASGAVWMAPADGDAGGRDAASGWNRADWRLVAAVGSVESHHAAGRDINALGDVSPWIVGPALDGSNSHYEVVADTDGGTWDLDVAADRAVGPMQILPATMARLGADANRDGMADPHNVWDAALTAARYLCLAGPDVREAIWAYNHSPDYVAAVAAEYLALAEEAGEDEAAPLPDGLPLGHAAVPEGSPLAQAPPMMAAVVARWAALSGFSADVEPHCVGHRCAWIVEEAPETVRAWEDALTGIGAQGPVAAEGKVLFAGDATRRAQLPELAAGAALSWPVAVAAPPQSASPDIDGAVLAAAAPPRWWAHHLPAGDPAWTAPTPAVALPAVKGALVGSPADGLAAFAGDGCASIADAHGWVWMLCGVDHRWQQGGPIRAGQMAGTAAGNEITVELFAPGGQRACPGAVFDHWAFGLHWTPKAIDDAHTAQQQPAEPPEPPAGFPPELAAALIEPPANAGQTGAGQPVAGQGSGDGRETVSESNPIRECGNE